MTEKDWISPIEALLGLGSRKKDAMLSFGCYLCPSFLFFAYCDFFFYINCYPPFVFAKLSILFYFLPNSCLVFFKFQISLISEKITTIFLI